jgi:hypothetical protein
LPEISAHFAATEYPRFLAALAEDAGLGELWTTYRNHGAALVQRIMRRAMEAAASSPARPAKRRKRRENPPSATPADDPELSTLSQAVMQAQADIERLCDSEPLIEFLLSRTDGAQLGSAACARIAPRLRAIAERWEAAPKGWVGWREHALALADAMQLAGSHPDLVLLIAG